MSAPYSRHPLANGTILEEKYRIIRLLGKGGFGMTYLAEHITFGEYKVIKEYFPHQQGQREANSTAVQAFDFDIFTGNMERFFREALLLRKCEHPNIVPVNDVFQQNRTAYLVMDYIGSQTLANWLASNRQADVHTLNRIFLPLLDALDYLHQRHIIHRDIKPDNILLPDANTPILIDFGAARQSVSGKHDSFSVPILTEGYAPAEQYLGKTSPQSDIYALAATMHHTVTGHRPEVAAERSEKPNADNLQHRYANRYPKAWLAVIDKAFSVNKENRYASAAEMKKALLKAASPSKAKPTTESPKFAEPKSQKQPLTLLQQKAENGDAKAQYRLAENYYYGTASVQQNYAEAVKWYRQAAEQGHATAQCNLGYIYEDGKGVAQDDKEAVKWYRKAAEQGDADGQNLLGNMYEYGKGVAQDDKEAVKWYRKAAEQGHAHGQFNLGVVYAKGKGVAQDDKESAKWLRKAAEQGLASGQSNLGYMYEYGKGVTQDDKEAVKWYRKAAEQGHAYGQYNLGDMYEYGKGVNKDLAMAELWYGKAAAQGNLSAKEALKRLNAQ